MYGEEPGVTVESINVSYFKLILKYRIIMIMQQAEMGMIKDPHF